MWNLANSEVNKGEITCYMAKAKVGRSVTGTRAIPLLVSVDQRLYVHYSQLDKERAFEAYKGNLEMIFDQVEEEIRECDPNGEIVIHGTCVWGGKDVEDLGTISLSEFGLTRDNVRKS